MKTLQELQKKPDLQSLLSNPDVVERLLTKFQSDFFTEMDAQLSLRLTSPKLF
jgi:hypothetical protein